MAGARNALLDEAAAEIGVNQTVAGPLHSLKKLFPLDAFFARKAAENSGFVNAHIISIILSTIVLCIRFYKNAVSPRGKPAIRPRPALQPNMIRAGRPGAMCCSP